MNTKSLLKLTTHLEEAAKLARHPQPAFIACHRDGLRALAKAGGDEALCRDAANFIQKILDAKHACSSSEFGGYGGELGARFDAEFLQRCPRPDRDLAQRLDCEIKRLRNLIGIGEKAITAVWGKGIVVQ